MNATPAIAPTERLWTREEYYKMDDAGAFRPGERVELIGGRIVTMSPQNSPHATSLLLLHDALRQLFPVGYVGRMQLPFDLTPSSQPGPGVAVVSGSVRDYAHAHPKTAVLATEVAESTIVFDRGEKASLYASAGIPEYWIVNLRSQRLEAYRDPVPMTDEPYGYGYRTSTQFVAGDTVSPLAGPQGIIEVTDLLP